MMGEWAMEHPYLTVFLVCTVIITVSQVINTAIHCFSGRD